MKLRKRAVRHSRFSWIVYASQGRVNLVGAKAQVCTHRRTRTHDRAYESIRKWAYTDTRTRTHHTSSLAFLSTYLCHEYSRASHIGFSIFDISLARTLERSNVKVYTRGNYPVRAGRMRDHIPFLSVNRAIEHVSLHFRQSVADEAGTITIWIHDIWTKYRGGQLNRFVTCCIRVCTMYDKQQDDWCLLLIIIDNI